MRAEKNEKFNMHELSDVMNVNNEILEQEAAHQANFLVNTKPVYSDTRVSFGEVVVRINRYNFEFSILDLSLTFIFQQMNGVKGLHNGYGDNNCFLVRFKVVCINSLSTKANFFLERCDPKSVSFRGVQKQFYLF
jgi:hypothetical protein